MDAKQMIKAFKIATQVTWAISMIVLGTAIGGIYGWEQHGWLGATMLGFVGLMVGAFMAASPSLLLQFLA